MSTFDGYSALNRHYGGVKSGLAYYVRTAGGGIIYDLSNRRQDLFSGKETRFAEGSYLRMINDQQILLDTPDVTFRGPRPTYLYDYVKVDCATDRTDVIYYSVNTAAPTTDKYVTYSLNDDGDLTITATNLDFDIITSPSVTLSTVNANNSINIADESIATYTSFQPAEINIGNINGDITKTVNIDIAGASVSCGGHNTTVTCDGEFRMTATDELWISGTDAVNIGTANANSPINIGTSLAKNIKFNGPVTLNGADMNATNGGVATAANGPVDTYSQSVGWLPFNYGSPTAGSTTGKILIAGWF